MGYGSHPSDFSSARAPGKVGQHHGENRRLIPRKEGPAFPGFPLTGYAIWQENGPALRVIGRNAKRGRHRKSFVEVVRSDTKGWRVVATDRKGDR